ncbi:MAG: hypothetical protein AAGI13_02915 [Pseudomonadota bacterium]
MAKQQDENGRDAPGEAADSSPITGQTDQGGRVFRETSSDRRDQMEINDILLEHTLGGSFSSRLFTARAANIAEAGASEPVRRTSRDDNPGDDG